MAFLNALEPGCSITLIACELTMRYLTRYGAPLIFIILAAVALSACGSSASLPDYSLGGAVNGLRAGNSVVLRNNGGDNLTVAHSGSFTFPIGFAPGSSYAVTIFTQPAGQACVVVNGSGEMPGAVSVLAAPTGAHGVSDIVVNCSAGAGPFTVSGTVAGLLPGNTLVLQDSGGNDATVSANGSFAFSAPLASGTAYAVTVLTQPPGQNCAVSNGSGAAILANVADVAVVCSDNTYNIAAVVSGLLANHSLVLRLNGANNLTVSANGTATFSAPIPSGSSYAVTVLTQPVGESCTVTNGTGTVTTANIGNVAVTCSPAYIIGGTVSGLTATVVLQDNAADNLSITANGSFAFNTLLASGSTYAVTILTQPTGQTCAVSNGTGGVISANVTDVTVTCTTATAGSWTWESGSQIGNAVGAYGTQGIAAAANGPGAREGAVSWADGAGNLWLLGGTGTDSAGNSGGKLNDLWRYTLSTGLWTWIGGSNIEGANGVYGTKGIAAAGNVPGARDSAASWTDAAGNLWLFGGTPGFPQNFNDLWRYSPSTNSWTWMSGSQTFNADGVYGTRGTAAAGNVPGARTTAVTWTDMAGNLWLFGGTGFDSTGGNGDLNDLWRYSPSSNLWTWISGSNTAAANGVYGTQGTAAAGNVPGARAMAVSWTDSAGDLWLFGGFGNGPAQSPAVGPLNDLWRYGPSSDLWTWMSGTATVGAAGVFGTKGIAAVGNVPGARAMAVSWTDSAGNLWLFSGNDSLNDLWQYNPNTNLWAWMSGSNMLDGAVAVYGTKGTAAPGNVPGPLVGAVSWADASGNFWLLGGASGGTRLNDLWKYVPPTP
jgi:N-acetylneuraminic acid mutarotase